ncbi:GATA transcription factor 17-like isoform X1 [Zingiber officinale]|uniref:GATA transcription factor 17-like isoform X1 n=1 Tax=Zingiber officinale TaxID=94328 RepID=UPI001C4B95E1|nr:GATA transcription factor 17-like isoform X1 [Zingiber officinale]
MSGNPIPLDGVNPAGVESFPGHHFHNMSAGHQVLTGVSLPSHVDESNAVGGTGELIAAADALALQQYEEADCSSGSHGMEEEGVGAVENGEMETEGPSGPSHLGDTQALGPVQAGGNQLTLSFQGEVYVFDSVSPEKVQAVLLLLGGREMQTGSNPFPPSTIPTKVLLNITTCQFSFDSLMTSGAFDMWQRGDIPHRLASLMRFREKRKERNFEKKIRYTVRKEVASRMQRNKGQFTSSKSKTDCSMGDATGANQESGSPENKIPGASACHHCGISAHSTPMMRRGPDGPRTLCNACGLVWANKGMMRDLSKNPSPAIPNALPEPTEGATFDITV